jgi:hypothetical protein
VRAGSGKTSCCDHLRTGHWNYTWHRNDGGGVRGFTSAMGLLLLLGLTTVNG